MLSKLFPTIVVNAGTRIGSCSANSEADSLITAGDRLITEPPPT